MVSENTDREVLGSSAITPSLGYPNRGIEHNKQKSKEYSSFKRSKGDSQ